jgi:hypothetical protein
MKIDITQFVSLLPHDKQFNDDNIEIKAKIWFRATKSIEEKNFWILLLTSNLELLDNFVGR